MAGGSRLVWSNILNLLRFKKSCKSRSLFPPPMIPLFGASRNPDFLQ
ncbi:hypothetical protein LINGRAPRIM_LOCUS492 [Linum grandiflorum]